MMKNKPNPVGTGSFRPPIGIYRQGNIYQKLIKCCNSSSHLAPPFAPLVRISEDQVSLFHLYERLGLRWLGSVGFGEDGLNGGHVWILQ